MGFGVIYLEYRQLIEVKPLSEYPDYAPILAYWSFNEWYINRTISFDVLLKSYMKRIENDTLPLSFVAVKDTRPVGMVSLKMDDLWSRKDINPWLASLYVVPEFRNNGIGEMLVSVVIKKTKIMGFHKLFLFFDVKEKNQLRSFYNKRGWNYYDKADDNDGKETEILYYKIQE